MTDSELHFVELEIQANKEIYSEFQRTLTLNELRNKKPTQGVISRLENILKTRNRASLSRSECRKLKKFMATNEVRAAQGIQILSRSPLAESTLTDTSSAASLFDVSLPPTSQDLTEPINPPAQKNC